MYQVGVIVKFEDGTEEQKRFDLWGEASAWIEYLANENESVPAKVKMWIIR